MRFAINTLSNLGKDIARSVIGLMAAKLIVRKGTDRRSSSVRLSALVVVDQLGVPSLSRNWHALAWRLQTMVTGMPITASPITTSATNGASYGCLCYAATKQRSTQRFAEFSATGHRVVAG